MIEKTEAFKVGNESFLTLEAAQRFELRTLRPTNGNNNHALNEDIIDWVMHYKAEILNILATTERNCDRGEDATIC